MSNKYIKTFNQIGECELNQKLIIKDWNDRFSICSWKNEKEEEYKLVINGKRKNSRLLKVQISVQQAYELIMDLNLVEVPAGMPRSASSYHTESFVKSEIERFKQMFKEKKSELEFLSLTICRYEDSLF